MATITTTDMTGTGDRAVTTTTLTGSDAFSYGGGTAVLILRNGTGAPMTPNIIGSDAGTLSVPGYGTVDASAGFELSEIADGETVAVPLDSIRRYLDGDLTVESGSGLEAQLLAY